MKKEMKSEISKYCPPLYEVLPLINETIDTAYSYLNDYLIKIEDLTEAGQRDSVEFTNCIAILSIVNDVIHPFHDLSIKMRPDNKEFVEFLKARHAYAEKAGLTMKAFNKDIENKEKEQ